MTRHGVSASRGWIEHHFLAFGVHVTLRTDAIGVFGGLIDSDRELLPGWRRTSGKEDGIAASYDLRTSNRPPQAYELFSENERIAVGDEAAMLRSFVRHAELLVAERSPDYLFVHAGVVGWGGRAVLMPGHSMAGKTTLVRTFLDAGATYYSDEYAVLDREGRVHPYPRPLSIRCRSEEPRGDVRYERPPAPRERPALAVALILATSYCGSRWRPRRLTAAWSVIELMRHTVAARGTPAHSMPILNRTTVAAHAFAGPRGEAPDLVAKAISWLESTRSNF
jgi:hypothetical protein